MTFNTSCTGNCCDNVHTAIYVLTTTWKIFLVILIETSQCFFFYYYMHSDLHDYMC